MVGTGLSEKGKKISLSSELTIYNVVQMREMLAEELRNESVLTIDLSNVKQMDTTGFQLLLSLKKTAWAKKKQVIFVGHTDEVLKFMDIYGVAGLFGDWLDLSEESKGKFEFKYGLKTSQF